MYTRMVWRSDDLDDGDADVIAKKSIRQTIKRRIKLWDNGEFTTLLAELRQKAKRKDVESSLKTRQRKCIKYVKEGEFKKARQALMNTPKWNGSVEEKLIPLYPGRSENLCEESTKHNTTIN